MVDMTTPEEVSRKEALYFGCWNSLGHYLHDVDGKTLWWGAKPADFPWEPNFMDGGLLKNGKVPDVYDGKVHWTCGGRITLWYAFFWWDNSVDHRGASNSAFYVTGYPPHHAITAFRYACEQFPSIVRRQKYPLELQVGHGIPQR